MNFEKNSYEKLSNKNLKKLQRVEIEILDEVVKICNKHNLSYYLVGGTLLGAVRHKGFIPWDDDIDIGILRDDYEKFLEVAPLEIDDKFYIENRKYNKNFHLPYIKVKKNNTEYKEGFTPKLGNHNGIFIDIFPLNNIKKPNGFFTKIRLILIKNTIQAVQVKLKLTSLRECRRPLLCFLYQPFSVNTLYKFHKFLMTMDDKKNTNYLCNLCSTYKLSKEIFERKLLEQAEYDFENKKYTSFKDYNTYLTKVYGDYMTLPPEDERIIHGSSEVHFNHGDDIKMKNIIKNK